MRSDPGVEIIGTAIAFTFRVDATGVIETIFARRRYHSTRRTKPIYVTRSFNAFQSTGEAKEKIRC
jgi:hypothetical protein